MKDADGDAETTSHIFLFTYLPVTRTMARELNKKELKDLLVNWLGHLCLTVTVRISRNLGSYFLKSSDRAVESNFSMVRPSSCRAEYNIYRKFRVMSGHNYKCKLLCEAQSISGS